MLHLAGMGGSEGNHRSDMSIQEYFTNCPGLCLDLYRTALPTAYASRLPSHLLRFMPERVVLCTRIPTTTVKLLPEIYMSVLSRRRA